MDATGGKRPELMDAARNWAALVRQFHEHGGRRRATSIADFMGRADAKHLRAVLDGKHWPQIDFVCRLAMVLGQVLTLEPDSDNTIVPRAESVAPEPSRRIRFEDGD